jgi:predicted nucleic acid-binding protein
LTVLIDSWAWIEYFQGSEAGKRVRAHIDSAEEVIISTINVAEVFRHFLAKASKKDAEDAVRFMLGRSFSIAVSVDIALSGAAIKHEKKWGLGDSLILATARSKGATVVTGDDDFKNEKDVVFLG